MKEERQSALKEITRRVKLSPDRLPSICLYTILNAQRGYARIFTVYGYPQNKLNFFDSPI